jgi:hypothetical protein
MEFRNIDEYNIYIGGLDKTQLLDIVDNIDKEGYPDRYAAALSALVKSDNYKIESNMEIDDYGNLNIDTKRLEGFGGWILIYSLYAGIISPYNSISNIITIINSAQYLKIVSQKFKYIICLNILNELWIGIIGILVGYLLARKNPKAKRIVFIYLWVQMIFRLLVLLVPIVMGLPWSFLPGMQDGSYKYAIYGIIVISILLFYFLKSKRFNNTYINESG